MLQHFEKYYRCVKWSEGVSEINLLGNPENLIVGSGFPKQIAHIFVKTSKSDKTSTTLNQIFVVRDFQTQLDIS